MLNFSSLTWLNEIRTRLLQIGDFDASVNIGVESPTVKSHRRVISDMPVFDGDNVSVIGR